MVQNVYSWNINIHLYSLKFIWFKQKEKYILFTFFSVPNYLLRASSKSQNDTAPATQREHFEIL
jgi:hypothetical protein